jgi:hypothetical protein
MIAKPHSPFTTTPCASLPMKGLLRDDGVHRVTGRSLRVACPGGCLEAHSRGLQNALAVGRQVSCEVEGAGHHPSRI